MPRRYLITTILSILIPFVFAGRAAGGGWALVTLEYLPSDIHAGGPFTVEFSVRGHGQILGAGHIPTVFFYQAAGQNPLRFSALETGQKGRYAAEIVLPENGTWTWRISPYDSPGAAQNMPDLKVSPAGSASKLQPGADLSGLAFGTGFAGLLMAVICGAVYLRSRKRGTLVLSLAGFVLALLATPALIGGRPTAVLAAQNNALQSMDGQDLFRAKGCVVCHYHPQGREGYAGLETNIGPNLIELKLPADYLRLWLADPPAIRPKTLMPNLNLSEAEIDSLVAFLTGS